MTGSKVNAQVYGRVDTCGAYPEERDGVPGYVVAYPAAGEMRDETWVPKDIFESEWHGFGETGSRLGQESATSFVLSSQFRKSGEKTVVCLLTLRNGYEVTASSSCVDPANFDFRMGCEIAERRAMEKVYELLGFVLQWLGNGLEPIDSQRPEHGLIVDASDVCECP